VDLDVWKSPFIVYRQGDIQFWYLIWVASTRNMARSANPFLHLGKEVAYRCNGCNDLCKTDQQHTLQDFLVM